ncbi:MAG: DJ-1 family glyoxalase III [Bullifex sp.]
MKRALIFLAEGFEEVEALSVLDALKRGNVEVVTAAVGTELQVRSSHGVKITADAPVSDIKEETFDLVFLPGGMPGSINLAQSWDVNEIIIRHAQNKLVAAICAAPAVVLGPAGLLGGRKATCYPGCEEYFPGFEFSSDGVVEDGNIITAKSAAYAWPLGFLLVGRLMGSDAADKVRKGIYWEF